MGSNRRWCLVRVRQSCLPMTLVSLLSYIPMASLPPLCRAGARAREGSL